jgi:hypothetical protein
MDENKEPKDTKSTKGEADNNSNDPLLQTCRYNNERVNQQQETCFNQQKRPVYALVGTVCSVIMTITTVSICVVTGIYTYYAREQIRETRKAVDIAEASLRAGDDSMRKTWAAMKEQTEAMQDTSKASQDAVKLAKRSIEATQEQFRLDQRAWVGVIERTPPAFQDGTRHFFVKEGERCTLGVMIKNSGKTPAIHFKSKQMMHSLPANVPFTPHYTIPTVDQSLSVIQPGMTAVLSALPSDVPVTREHIKMLGNGQLILYVYGEMTYEDIFGKKHNTTYCLFLDKDLSNMNSCDTYNKAD